ncbi:MAG: aldehyde dehydrogenase [Cyclobacteriaceae bacterium]|nr:aldehyde dehydrogenase [Cyclobacteriaceae bacterium]
MKYPEVIPNLIGHQEVVSGSGKTFSNINPCDGSTIGNVTSSNAADVTLAVKKAQAVQKAWAKTAPVVRGRILYEIVDLLSRSKQDLAEMIGMETGKSVAASMGEVNGAIDLARFFAGEGQRLYGKTTVSGVEGKQIYHLREPIGIAGLIISANTPIANIAWKVFPALICGNAAILKASEDAPATAYLFGKIVSQSGLPDGVLSIIQGNGNDAGNPIVDHPAIGVISFTGSTAVGRKIAIAAGNRLARVSLELGGKNPLVVCDDADIDLAVKWILLSGFSNAGQRCAAASRIIIFESIYDLLKSKLIEGASRLKLGVSDTDDLGPLIRVEQVNFIERQITEATGRGAKVLLGGKRSTRTGLARGFYMEPTIVENVLPEDPFSQTELFGPVITLYRVKDLSEAIAISNQSNYGLTSCIHTTDFNTAIHYSRQVEAGLCNINGPTYGSEPHLPFGGVKNSGNGTREPGTEALDVYSNLKTVSYFI